MKLKTAALSCVVMVGLPRQSAAEMWQEVRGSAEPVERTEPEYSEEARVAGLEGVVELEGVVFQESVQNLRIIRSLGLGLDEKASESVRRWRFAPHPEPTPGKFSVGFVLPQKQSRWHLIDVKFDTPEGASRPTFLRTYYPGGPGISRASMEQGQLVAALRRMGAATVAFTIDETGRPVQIRPIESSHETWANEAAELIREWSFKPGLRDGRPLPVPCTLRLVWGAKSVAADVLAKATSGDYAPEQPLEQSLTPTLIFRPEPAYSDEARRARLEGSVEISLTIDSRGVPRDLKVVKSLGLGLDEGAMDAVARWRFRPGGESPVSAIVSVPFRLPKD